MLFSTPVHRFKYASLFTCRILKLSQLTPLRFSSDIFELVHLSYIPVRNLLITLSQIQRKTQSCLSDLRIIRQHKLIKLHLLY